MLFSSGDSVLCSTKWAVDNDAVHRTLLSYFISVGRQGILDGSVLFSIVKKMRMNPRAVKGDGTRKTEVVHYCSNRIKSI